MLECLARAALHGRAPSRDGQEWAGCRLVDIGIDHVDAAHVEANPPSVTLALLARIRRLEGLLTGVADMLRSTGDYPLTERQIREELEKGTVMP